MCGTRAPRSFCQFLLTCCLLISNVRSFGQGNILALASTCKKYAEGLDDELRRAKQLTCALVRWPAADTVVVLTKNILTMSSSWLLNGTSFLVRRGVGDYVEAQALTPVCDLRVLLPRRSYYLSICHRLDGHETLPRMRVDDDEDLFGPSDDSQDEDSSLFGDDE